MADYPAGPAAGASTYAPATIIGLGGPAAVGGQGHHHAATAAGGAGVGEKMEAPSASRAAAHTLGQLHLS